MRVVIYTAGDHDQQADQQAICLRHAESEGHHVAAAAADQPGQISGLAAALQAIAAGTADRLLIASRSVLPSAAVDIATRPDDTRRRPRRVGR